MRVVRLPICTIVLLGLTACGGPKTPSGPPVVVYASESDAAELQVLFDAFTAETGIPVSVEWGGSKENADALINKTGTPADVLITPTVVDIWRVAEEGALRPIQSEALTSIDPQLREPERLWVAMQRSDAQIVSSAGDSAPPSGNYPDLATPRFRGKLCLSSVDNSINQAVIAMLIEDFGLKPAERMVRAWVANLAQAPFETEQALSDALASGACEFGIISSAVNRGAYRSIDSDTVYYDVAAVGVGRHAQNSERAQRLVHWLIVNHPVVAPSHSNGRNVGVAGWRNEEVFLLADRVGYR